MAVLSRNVELGKEHWAKGGFTATSVEQTAMLNAMAVGQTKALLGVIEMDYETLVSEIEDEQHGE